MLFWLVLQSLQLFGAEAAEPGFSGRKVDTKLLNQIKSKCDEILRGAFLFQMTGNQRRRRGGHPPGSQKGAALLPGRASHPAGCLVVPPRCPLSPIKPP